FGIRSASRPRRPFALNLLLLWSYLTSAEAAHAKVPPHAESISRMPHQETFRANIFKEHHELQLEKHDGVNGGTATSCIGLLNKLAHKGEIECAFQMTIKVI